MNMVDSPTILSRNELLEGAEHRSFRKLKLQCAKFMDETPLPIADMGEPNPAKDIIEEELEIKIDSIYGFDFDKPDLNKMPKNYGTILCLEVLEHLFNPLLFLSFLKGRLKEDGLLYLSTPSRLKLLWTEHHFHEIDRQRLQWLFDKAGFRVEKEKRIKIYRRWRWGFRPFLRLFMGYTTIYKLRKV